MADKASHGQPSTQYDVLGTLDCGFDTPKLGDWATAMPAAVLLVQQGGSVPSYAGRRARGAPEGHSIARRMSSQSPVLPAGARGLEGNYSSPALLRHFLTDCLGSLLIWKNLFLPTNMMRSLLEALK